MAKYIDSAFNQKATRLEYLMAIKIVWVEGGEYVGRAADGIVVSLGSDRLGVESYLETNPTPDKW